MPAVLHGRREAKKVFGWVIFLLERWSLGKRNQFAGEKTFCGKSSTHCARSTVDVTRHSPNPEQTKWRTAHYRSLACDPKDVCTWSQWKRRGIWRRPLDELCGWKSNEERNKETNTSSSDFFSLTPAVLPWCACMRIREERMYTL